jgi:integrase
MCVLLHLIDKGKDGGHNQHMSEQEPTYLNQKSGRKVAGKRLALSKTDARFWHSRLFKWEGSANYSTRIQFRGRRMAFSLGTGNRDAAARRASGIYSDLLALGVEATLAKHRAQTPPTITTGATTIGDWISEAIKVFDGKPASFGGYARGLRFIASEILDVSKNKKRYGRTQAKNYRRQVDAAPLTILTPEAIQAWRIRYVKRVGESPARQRSARISCNSAIRQAHALFSRQILGFIDTGLVPTPLPFSDVKFYPRESMRYQSRIEPAALLQSAKENLFESDPEAFKALLLALGAGLRRGEIDRLLWRQIDFTAGVIRIEATEAGGLKTEDSAGTVPIDVGLVSLLRGFKAKARGQYVLEEGSGVTASKPWGQRYRCADAFSRLTQWLRSHGVEGAKPIHTLRKEAGSIIVTKAGIHAASQFLRHADIQVTSMHYADHKERVTVDIGGLLAPTNVVGLAPPKQSHIAS